MNTDAFLASELEAFRLTAAEVVKLVPGLSVKDIKNWTERNLVAWEGRQGKVNLKRLYSLRTVVQALALCTMRTVGAPLERVGVKFADVLLQRLEEHLRAGIVGFLDRETRHFRVYVYQVDLENEVRPLSGFFFAGNVTLHELSAHLPLSPPDEPMTLANAKWELRMFPIDLILALLVHDYLVAIGATTIEADEMERYTVAEAGR